MSYIDKTYFTVDLEIPNLESDAVLQRVNNLIETYEPRFLQDLFGYGFYKLFTAGVTAQEARYLAILNGTDYTDSSNREYRWRGLLDNTTNTKRSPIAMYVYYHYERGIASQSTGIGQVETVPTGARPASAADKMARAWNEMVDYCWQLRYFMQAPASITTYPEWQTQQYNALGEVYKKINLFNFL